MIVSDPPRFGAALRASKQDSRYWVLVHEPNHSVVLGQCRISAEPVLSSIQKALHTTIIDTQVRFPSQRATNILPKSSRKLNQRECTASSFRNHLPVHSKSAFERCKGAEGGLTVIGPSKSKLVASACVLSARSTWLSIHTRRAVALPQLDISGTSALRNTRAP